MMSEPQQEKSADFAILVLGVANSGKSTFINWVLRSLTEDADGCRACGKEWDVCPDVHGQRGTPPCSQRVRGETSCPRGHTRARSHRHE
ncbi:hypothetical protein FA13DRAFT_1413404 [Coprinellus micaceus]|uniref:G domain-containing protein n=1 Tax=Coprinellus micaceus TaxID=71717 RepID=A0A4Y7SNI4_COPMI|nr:hypothetical protein FA13DRAFT_1413404 [Coprinellus micaceus]